MRNGKDGFTLVEMLVVILIITVLMSLLGVFIVGLIDRAAYARTVAIVKKLDEGCRTYHVNYGAFFPKDKGDGSFHYYLGSDRMLPVSRLEGIGDILTRRPPIVEFTRDDLKDPPAGAADPQANPLPMIDAWEQIIQYTSPGSYNPKGVDIWSPGKDGTDQLNPADPNFDDVTNWNKEY